ncbi:MAG: FkbM family methyltransferase [Clostridiales bacterium]|jgi:hypothetical protein|nr:FkbM family methyltransferase [Clostridiales bacterium]
MKEIFTVEGYTYNDEVSVHESAVVFDIGGNIGDTALYFAKRATNGKIFTFEPEPANFAALTYYKYFICGRCFKSVNQRNVSKTMLRRFYL